MFWLCASVQNHPPCSPPTLHLSRLCQRWFASVRTGFLRYVTQNFHVGDVCSSPTRLCMDNKDDDSCRTAVRCQWRLVVGQKAMCVPSLSMSFRSSPVGLDDSQRVEQGIRSPGKLASSPEKFSVQVYCSLSHVFTCRCKHRIACLTYTEHATRNRRESLVQAMLPAATIEHDVRLVPTTLRACMRR